MPDEDGLVTRERFMELVGASEASVSAALNALKLVPVSLVRDRRQKRYRVEWVPQVQRWIQETYGAAL